MFCSEDDILIVSAIVILTICSQKSGICLQPKKLVHTLMFCRQVLQSVVEY